MHIHMETSHTVRRYAYSHGNITYCAEICIFTWKHHILCGDMHIHMETSHAVRRYAYSHGNITYCAEICIFTWKHHMLCGDMHIHMETSHTVRRYAYSRGVGEWTGGKEISEFLTFRILVMHFLIADFAYSCLFLVC